MMTAMILSMLLAGGAADDVRIDSGRGKFDSMPQIVSGPLPNEALVTKVEHILASGACRIDGQSAHTFDITVPYAVLVKPDGSTSHIIVADRGCPAIEKMVGEVVLQLAARGDFKGRSTSAPKWYASEMNFTLQ